MSKEILNLAPAGIWKYFYELTELPRPSGHEEKVRDYLKKFGAEFNLETVEDAIGNIVIRKAATPGMEDRKGIIMQGHIDMVPQANSDSNHDFLTDPIDAYVDGDWVTARGTTLGADNGMGVAAALAVLAADDLVHGPIEGFFTVDEEAGMTGVNNLKDDLLKGDILLNMDSEDEGELYVGCAGGEDANATFSYTEEATPDNFVGYKISIKGLKGGHSGMDIVLGRGNANKIMFRLLKCATFKHGVRLAMIDGGSLRNAIPREAFAEVAVNKAEAPEFEVMVAEMVADMKAELGNTEPEWTLDLEQIPAPKFLIDEKTAIAVADAVRACPNGVIRMSDSVPGLVETSSNLAIVKSENGEISIQCLMRSSVDSARVSLAGSIESVFRMAGAKASFDGAYPGWKPNMDSAILKEMRVVYNNMYGKIPEIKAIHAGLECGIIGGVYPNLDMISYGPTIRFPHSPDEKVRIDTVKKFWDFTVEVLKNAPKV